MSVIGFVAVTFVAVTRLTSAAPNVQTQETDFVCCLHCGSRGGRPIRLQRLRASERAESASDREDVRDNKRTVKHLDCVT